MAFEATLKIDAHPALIALAADRNSLIGPAVGGEGGLYHALLRDDARFDRLAPDPRLEAGPADAVPSPPAASAAADGATVTVTLGPDTVLSVSGENALLSRLTIADRAKVAAALAKALALALDGLAASITGAP